VFCFETKPHKQNNIGRYIFVGKTILFFIFSLFVASNAIAADAVRAICEGTPEEMKQIAECERVMRSETCAEIPQEQKIDCYDTSAFRDYSSPNKMMVNCAKGGFDAVKDGVNAAFDLASNAAKTAFTHADYTKHVKDEARKNCAKDKEVMKAEDHYRKLVTNLGIERAMEQYLQQLNDIKRECSQREIKKGENLGINIEWPKWEEFKPLLVCLNQDTMQELTCKFALPMIIGGEAAVLTKVGIRKALQHMHIGPAGRVQKALDKYIKEARRKGIPEVELQNLKHQTDLTKAMQNPEIFRRLEEAGINLEDLTNGILDSDIGKMQFGKDLMTKKSDVSDMGMNILKGEDKTSPAAIAYQKHLKNIGQDEPNLPSHYIDENGKRVDYSNDDIREIMSSRGFLIGRQHENPGMMLAFKEYNDLIKTPRIPPYKDWELAALEKKLMGRLDANQFHNHSEIDMEAGKAMHASGLEVKLFWRDFDQNLTTNAMGGEPKFKNFYQQTMYNSGKRTADGIVVVKYPQPSLKAVITHSVFDRLSQATGGGNTKIIFEVAGKLAAENPKIPIGKIPDFVTNSKTPNGLNTLAGNFTSLQIRSADGLKYYNKFSNGETTNVQFKGLMEAVDKATDATTAQKGPLKELVRAGRDRALVYDEWVKKRIDLTKDKNGNVTKMDFKDADGKYFDSITLDTPMDEVKRVLDKFQKYEERANGDPFTDLMNPRILTNAEKTAYGMSVGASLATHYHCNKKKVGYIKSMLSPSGSSSSGSVNPTPSNSGGVKTGQ
jgi:hypothetical protein